MSINGNKKQVQVSTFKQPQKTSKPQSRYKKISSTKY